MIFRHKDKITNVFFKTYRGCINIQAEKQKKHIEDCVFVVEGVSKLRKLLKRGCEAAQLCLTPGEATSVGAEPGVGRTPTPSSP